jgi:4-hydroxybenzoate polyprenyltransferase
MRFLTSAYHYINILSLDVAAGAVVSSLFFSEILGVAISSYTLAVLAITVWIIYTVDHLRDAMIIAKPASTPRHSFHQKNFRILIICVFTLLFIDAVIIYFFVPWRVIIYGSCLGVLVLFYLVFQRKFKFLKEFLVACLYTSGVVLPSFSLIGWDLTPLTFILTAQFCVTALINLLLFSLIDFEQDRQHAQNSFVTRFGRQRTRSAIWVLGTISICTSVFVSTVDSRSAIILILMNVVLLVILIFEKRFNANNYYRIIGDAIFFIPMLYLL